MVSLYFQFCSSSSSEGILYSGYEDRSLGPFKKGPKPPTKVGSVVSVVTPKIPHYASAISASTFFPTAPSFRTHLFVLPL